MSLPLAVAPPQAPGTSRAQLDDYATVADGAGLDLWVCHLPRAGYLDAVAVLAHLGATTVRSRLGAAVLLPTHHVADVLASQLATIHRLSGGRLEIGVGVGTRPGRHGAPGVSRAVAFEHAIAALRAVWGPDGPPLWIGANAPPAIERAARLADGWIGAGGSTLADFADNVRRLHDAAARAGRDPSSIRVAKRVFLLQDEDAVRGRDRLDAWFRDVYGTEFADAGVAGTERTCLAHLEQVLDAGAEFVLVHAPVDTRLHLDWVLDRALPALGDRGAAASPPAG